MTECKGETKEKVGRYTAARTDGKVDGKVGRKMAVKIEGK